MFNPVCSRPSHVQFCILKLVPELHGNAVFVEGEELLAESIGLFASPFRGEEGDNCRVTTEECGTVAPGAVGSIGFGYCLGVSGEGVLGRGWSQSIQSATERIDGGD